VLHRRGGGFAQRGTAPYYEDTNSIPVYLSKYAPLLFRD
jgi:hypothetical protein